MSKNHGYRDGHIGGHLPGQLEWRGRCWTGALVRGGVVQSGACRRLSDGDAAAADQDVPSHGGGGVCAPRSAAASAPEAPLFPSH
jgi:hypothetical protein